MPLQKQFTTKSRGNPSLMDITVGEKQWLISVATNRNIGDQPWYSISAIPRDIVLGPAVMQAQIALFVPGDYGRIDCYSQLIGR